LGWPICPECRQRFNERQEEIAIRSGEPPSVMVDLFIMYRFRRMAGAPPDPFFDMMNDP